MAQAVLERVLQDMKSLEAEELCSVTEALKSMNHSTITISTNNIEYSEDDVDYRNHPTLGYDEPTFRAMQMMVADGAMREIKPRLKRSLVEFNPITIPGKPVSETIMEERR